MRLRHLHLPNKISYARSLQLQEALLEKHFAYNTHVLQASNSPTSTRQSPIQPNPTLLTFQTDPVYTVGRRHLKSNPLSPSQIDFLTTNSTSPALDVSKDAPRLATFYPSPRGGLLTYHAPGQLTAYMIINLRAHGITPRCFIRLLENSVIRTCARHGVPNTLTTEDPGVWIAERNSGMQDDTSALNICGGDTTLKATTRKICAIGVHVTRGVTSHGIGLNVCDTAIAPTATSYLYTLPQAREAEPQPAPGYLSWGFSRIIACGLEGKSVTWLTNEGADTATSPDAVAKSLAEELCQSLTQQGKIGITGVDSLNEAEILASSISPSHDQFG